ncbi:anti-sigma factor family protein [Desulfallas thermosapovorans]|uniref:Anti-sigma-W factor RsiW n=1 Tax=Desulfallas thermosapovorans DSM 6562 TaxID=1121431 RepID=A0A5S4ZUB7_9FIRM|nr:zf-HC2 domain-containing protein [Desulfallas thermosapovorans]TYO96577.1 uncharacterized protein DUF4349 [Desulfallas thermosapovorans DSM 6562]
MQCDNHIKEMISAWLDGELDQAQAEAVERHLGECTACREDLVILQEIQAELRACAMEIPAPEGFSAAVMSRIAEPEAGSQSLTASGGHNSSRGRVGRWASAMANWKRGIAAAAATVLIACGSYAMATYSGLTEGTQLAGINKALIEKTEPGDNETTAPVQEPGNDTETVPGGNNTPGDRVGEDTGPQNSNSENDHDVNTPDNPSTGNGDSDTPPANQNTPNPATGTEQDPEIVALLSTEKQRLIESTLIKTRVEEPETVREQVNSLAGQHNANLRLMESRNTAGEKYLAYELTVDQSNAGQLIAGLERLGALQVKDKNSKDISDQYNNLVEQYQWLDAQLRSGASAGEQEKTQQRMNEIKQQLKDWESDTGKHKIVIWLEQ